MEGALEILDHRESLLLIQGYSVILFHMLDVFQLVGHNKCYGLAGGGDTSRAADTIDIFLDVGRKVILKYPVDSFEV